MINGERFMIVDKKLLDELSEKARHSERLRMYLEPRRGTNTIARPHSVPWSENDTDLTDIFF